MVKLILHAKDSEEAHKEVRGYARGEDKVAYDISVVRQHKVRAGLYRYLARFKMRRRKK